MEEKAGGQGVVEPYSGGGMGGPGVVGVYRDHGVVEGPRQLEEKVFYDMVFMWRTESVEKIRVGRGGKVVGYKSHMA